MNAINTWDAQAALGFVTSQTTYIERQVNETIYPDVQYPQLVPVDTGANPFAKTVTYYSADRYGQASWINGNADDVPMAGTEMGSHETKVHTAGIGYGYGWEELNQAMSLGINLPASDALAARRAYEEFVDKVAFVGDAAKGFTGVANAPTVTPVAATNGDWDDPATTADDIIADFNALITMVPIGTNNVSYADTILLPHSRVTALASRRLGDTTLTLLQWLTQNNAFTQTTGRAITVRAIRGLETTGVGGVARAVAYRFDPNVLKLHIPMPHRFLQPHAPGPLRVEVPGVFRMGGVDVRRPREVGYMDGV